MTALLDGPYFAVRPVGTGEIEAVLAVYKRCEDFLALGPVPYATKQMVLDDMKSSEAAGGFYCGLWINNEMIGVIDFIPKGYEGKPEAAYLSLLMISVGCRNSGIGTDVVTVLEEYLTRYHNTITVDSGVQTNNPAGLRFWNKKGYRIIAGPELMPDRTVTYHLSKKLR